MVRTDGSSISLPEFEAFSTLLAHLPPVPCIHLVSHTAFLPIELTSVQQTCAWNAYLLSRLLYRIGNLSARFSGAWSPRAFPVSLSHNPSPLPVLVCHNSPRLSTPSKFVFLVALLRDCSLSSLLRCSFSCFVCLVPRVVVDILIFPKYIPPHSEPLYLLCLPIEMCLSRQGRKEWSDRRAATGAGT